MDEAFKEVQDTLAKVMAQVPSYREDAPAMIVLLAIVETRMSNTMSEQNSKILRDFVVGKSPILKIKSRRYFLLEQIAGLFMHLKLYDRGIKLCESLRREILIPEDDAPRMMRIAILESKIHEKQNRVDKAMETLAQTLLRLDKAEEGEMESLVKEVEGSSHEDESDEDDSDEEEEKKETGKDEEKKEEEEGEEKEEEEEEKTKRQYRSRKYSKPIMGLSEIPSHTKVMADELCRVYARHKKKDKVDLLVKKYNLNISNPPLSMSFFSLSHLFYKTHIKHTHTKQVHLCGARRHV